MDLNTLIAECTAYDYKEMLEDKKPKTEELAEERECFCQYFGWLAVLWSGQ